MQALLSPLSELADYQEIIKIQEGSLDSYRSRDV